MSNLTIENLADYFSSGWNKKRINDLEFDQIFSIEGIPLSWFYKRLLSLHTIPPQFKIRESVKKLVKGEKVVYDNKKNLLTKILTK